MIGGEHVLAQAIVQRLEPPARAADPAGKGRALQFDAMAGEDLRLPIERSVVAVFADQHLGEQRRRRQTAGNRPVRRGCLGHGIAPAAGVFRARDAQYTELGGNPIQHLADALPDVVQDTSTARTSVVRTSITTSSRGR